MVMIQCPECKKKISDGAEECPKCGYSITIEERKESVALAESQEAQAKSCGTVMGVGCLTIVLAVVVGTYLDSDKPRATTALERMSVVFQGGHSKVAIKMKLDVAFDLFGLRANEENYNRYGSVLVSLRKGMEVQEMEILDCAIAFAIEAGGVTDLSADLGEIMALCAATLKTKW